MAARPRFEITEEILKKTNRLASRGLTKQQIADCLGISKRTLERRQADTVAFDAAIKRGQSRGIKEITNALFEQAQNGNVTATIFYLKNRAPQEWRDRREYATEDLNETSRMKKTDAELLRELEEQRKHVLKQGEPDANRPTTH